jgi:hypothetical protein
VELEDNDSMLKHAMNFYKTLFREEPKEGISIGEDFWDAMDKISPEEMKFLKLDFLKKRLKRQFLTPMLRGPWA